MARLQIRESLKKRLPLLGVVAAISIASFNHTLTRRVVTLAHPMPQANATRQLDLLILHGKLVDGSGKKARAADVGISGDRIVFVGDAAKAHVTASRTIDATGLIVAPGFIDPHTHTLGDLTNDQSKSNQAYLMQGVTTVITGNDGGSVLNIGETLRKWDDQGIGTTAYCSPVSARFGARYSGRQTRNQMRCSSKR